uniref:pyridoxal phosphate-dependent aminotransferase n=1 Tax=Pararhizobium sp. IMCC3301 TaxID=3067904 RepID=UPI0027403872|nr:aminotransferase class I/II-fold pyridoxal phosphate-dependent enzyme [Pararhizobium sp. IMCC3301]
MKPPILQHAASLRSAVDPFLAMDVMVAAQSRAAEGKPVLRMEVGEPGHQAPIIVREAAKAAIDQDRISYTPALGLPALRERISAHYQLQYGATVPRQRIAITTGSSAGFILSFLSAFDSGARVGLAAPGYPAYRNVMKALGLVAVSIPVRAENRYVITPQDVEAVHAQAPLDGLLIASPANPSGTMLMPQAFTALIKSCNRCNIRLISDEIYHGLVYEGTAETALSHTDQSIVINSFSKYYCMTGWRIGWMILPEDLVRPVERLAQSLYISAPYISQIAAIKAFDATPELDAIRELYARNRQKLLTALPQIGFESLHPADGAFYVYADARRFTNDALDFSRTLLDSTGVAATPGVDFDPDNGQTMMRFSYAGDAATIDRAIAAMARWLE